YEERIVGLDDFARHCAQTVAETIGAAIAEGFLPAAPDKDMCRWCDYLAVCGPNEERRVKCRPKDRLVPLNTVRELPCKKHASASATISTQPSSSKRPRGLERRPNWSAASLRSSNPAGRNSTKLSP